MLNLKARPIKSSAVVLLQDFWNQSPHMKPQQESLAAGAFQDLRFSWTFGGREGGRGATSELLRCKSTAKPQNLSFIVGFCRFVWSNDHETVDRKALQPLFARFTPCSGFFMGPCMTR